MLLHWGKPVCFAALATLATGFQAGGLEPFGLEAAAASSGQRSAHCGQLEAGSGTPGLELASVVDAQGDDTQWKLTSLIRRAASQWWPAIRRDWLWFLGSSMTASRP